MSKRINRRTFGKVAIFTGATVTMIVAGKGLQPFITPKEKFLRLPGSVEENKFLGMCIKCGQCVQVCPYHAVKLLDINKGVAIGTPVIIPEERGCYLCDLLPCVLACPSGALNHDISDATQVNMGKAKVINKDACLGMKQELLTEDMISRLVSHGVKSQVEKELAERLLSYIGKPCTICKDFCPYPDKDEAISLEEGEKYSPIIKEKCVGCGVCQELCPSKVLSIEPK